MPAHPPMQFDREGFDPFGEELSSNAKIWEAVYLPAAKVFDDRMIEAWSKSIDVLLVFVSFVLILVQL
jgi:hypothetical protein